MWFLMMGTDNVDPKFPWSIFQQQSITENNRFITLRKDLGMGKTSIFGPEIDCIRYGTANRLPSITVTSLELIELKLDAEG